MKSLFFIISGLILTNTYALKYEINHPCHENRSAKGEIIINDDIDALIATQTIAKNHKVKIEVIENGIKGFYDLPGSNNLEIISSTSFKAYGWCYSINEKFPDVMPKDFLLANADEIKWFLGSSTYLNGEWVDYCTPVQNNNTFICR